MHTDFIHAFLQRTDRKGIVEIFRIIGVDRERELASQIDIASAVESGVGIDGSAFNFGKRCCRKRCCQLKASNNELDIGPEPDTISLLMSWGYKVEEIQVEMRERTAGESYLNFTKSVTYMLRMSISILLVQWFRRKK